MGLRSEELDEQLRADIHKALDRYLNSKEDNSKRHHNKIQLLKLIKLWFFQMEQKFKERRR